MKFDCGETWQEKIDRLEKWHRWFAWFPVKVSEHDCRWLEFVERKKWYGGFGYWSTFYRAL